MRVKPVLFKSRFNVRDMQNIKIMELFKGSMEFDGFNGTIAGCNHSSLLKASCCKAQAKNVQ